MEKFFEFLKNLPEQVWETVGVIIGVVALIVALIFLIKWAIKNWNTPPPLTGKEYWEQNIEELFEYYKYKRFCYPYRKYLLSQ